MRCAYGSGKRTMHTLEPDSKLSVSSQPHYSPARDTPTLKDSSQRGKLWLANEKIKPPTLAVAWAACPDPLGDENQGGQPQCHPGQDQPGSSGQGCIVSDDDARNERQRKPEQGHGESPLDLQVWLTDFSWPLIIASKQGKPTQDRSPEDHRVCTYCWCVQAQTGGLSYSAFMGDFWVAIPGTWQSYQGVVWRIHRKCFWECRLPGMLWRWISHCWNAGWPLEPGSGVWFSLRLPYLNYIKERYRSSRARENWTKRSKRFSI